MSPTVTGVHPEGLQAAARLLAEARNPLIIAQRGAGGETGFSALQAIAEEWAIPVCQYWAVRLALPLDHPMAAPADPGSLIEKADAILVVDSLAPWAPDNHRPAAGCRVVHLGQDPLYSRFPVRNFRCDIGLACEVEDGLAALKAAMETLKPAAGVPGEERREALAAANRAARARAIEQAEAGQGAPMTKEWVSLCLSRAIEGREASVFSELGCPMAPMSLDHPKAWYQEPHSGGLGWAFPAALGMQLAERDRLIVATMGDGSYMFANPVACHQIAEALELPLLVVILNNAEWGAVRQSVLDIYPDGYASRTNAMPLTGLSPIPDFARVAQASRAFARTVHDGAQLPAIIAEALRHIDENRGLALIDVHVRP